LRYRKAYEAMLHVSHLLEERLQQDPEVEDDAAEGEIAAVNGTVFEQEDPDSMEWTPTGATTPPSGCGPPPTAAKNMRHLLPDAGEGEYQLKERGENAVLLHKLQEGVIMDECIDKLVRDLPDVLSYENSATFTRGA
jgi:hypothetical protein